MSVQHFLNEATGGDPAVEALDAASDSLDAAIDEAITLLLDFRANGAESGQQAQIDRVVETLSNHIAY